MYTPLGPGTASSSRRGPSVWRHFDVLLALATVAVAAFGALMIYTATRDSLEAQGLSPLYYVEKQAIFLLIGIGVMVAVAAIDYRRYRDWAPLLYGLSVVMLLAVYAVGHKSRGAQAWFQVGSYQMEPSDFAEVGMIVALASFCAMCKGKLSGRALAVIVVLAAVPFILIYKQPDLGSALVLGAILVAVVVVGGVSARHLGLLTLAVIVASVGVVHFGVLKSYQQARLTSFIDTPNRPNPKLLATVAGASEYNLAESKITIGNGGLTGQGIGKGTQTNLSYVPEQRTDFIFTAVGEQVGFVGSALLLGLFAIMVWRTWRAATLARDQVGTLICVGVLAMLVFEVFENIGMTLGIMPVAGIPLPFMSYGGSAEVAAFAAVGLVLNVRMRRHA